MLKSIMVTFFRQLLFYTRLFLYGVTALIPFFHPAIIVSYDLPGIGLWLVIVPAMMFLAFYLSPPRLKIQYWLLISLACLLILAVVFGGFGPELFNLLLIGALSFILTTLVFHTQGKGRILAAVEVLFIGYLYVAFLNFSRSSEEIARASAPFAKALFCLGLFSLLAHALVLFLASFPQLLKAHGKRRLLIPLFVVLTTGLLLALFLPLDFIQHEIRINPLQEELERKLHSLEGDSRWPFDRESDSRNQRDRNGRLEGLERQHWDSEGFSRRSGSSKKQYAVMIVATSAQTLYLAKGYLGNLDPEEGFKPAPDEKLNQLSTIRLLETWSNPDPPEDLSRSPVMASFWTSLPERYLAYKPLEITPTVLREENFPYSYSFEAVFDLSQARAEDLEQSPELGQEEKESLRTYLSLPLTSKTDTALQNYLLPLLKEGQKPFARLLAILEGFRSFQYELGYTDKMDIPHILDFLLNSKTGDCSEFASALAILARYAGLPSRVVHGYLADQNLQLPKHRAGLAYLQQQLEVLKEYSLDELILVTTAHRHAWAQIYFVDYGWIDIEATTYAKPPVLTGDANEWNLVVPLIERQGEKPAAGNPFPWQIILVAGGLILLGGLVGIYGLRFIRELVFYLSSRRKTLAGLKALARLLLIRLVNRGYPLKKPSQTLLEYAEVVPAIAPFALVYNQLRYRSQINFDEEERLWQELDQAYRKTLQESPPLAKGLGGLLTKIFCLKGLFY